MLTNSRAAYHDHNHQRCIDAALDRARDLCSQQGARLTPLREAVLHLIWTSHRPLGAYAIADLLPAATGRKALAPTVYRSIEFLLDQGLIHRVASLNAYIGCPFPGSRHSELIMICRACGTAAELSADSVDSALSDVTRRAGFFMETQNIELLGLCPGCRGEGGPS
jgi:Fur family zinc uptake transcriptional regulator